MKGGNISAYLTELPVAESESVTNFKKTSSYEETKDIYP
jgi:hypothetical protein